VHETNRIGLASSLAAGIHSLDPPFIPGESS
jgi:hypothetical protein